MEPLSVPESSHTGARRILLTAAVIYVALFVVHVRDTFSALVAPQLACPDDVTGPFGRVADSIGYYAWLRSPLVDGDFHFDNEYAWTFVWMPGVEAKLPVTATGHRANHWPVGPALIWAPAVVTVHLILSGLGNHSPWPADGYSPPYELAVGGTSLALALVALVLAYRIGRRFAGPTAAAAAAALLTLGTPVVAYGATEVRLAHGPATAALTLFVFVWLRTFGSMRPGRWVAIGCLLGLTCLMCFQLATFAVLPTLEAIWLATRAPGWSARLEIAGRLVGAGLMSVAVFTPQLVVKQIVYGHPLGGLQKTAHNWLEPSLWTVLGSTDHSLFYWTPITLPALAALGYLALRNRRPEVTILATAVAVQIYTISALLGGHVRGVGWSFGFRFLTETCILLVPGAAVLFDRASRRTACCLAIGGGLLVGWNLLLLNPYRHRLPGGGNDPAAVFAMVQRDFSIRPFEGFAMLAAAGCLTVTLVAAFGISVDVAGNLRENCRPLARLVPRLLGAGLLCATLAFVVLQLSVDTISPEFDYRTARTAIREAADRFGKKGVYCVRTLQGFQPGTFARYLLLSNPGYFLPPETRAINDTLVVVLKDLPFEEPLARLTGRVSAIDPHHAVVVDVDNPLGFEQDDRSKHFFWLGGDEPATLYVWSLLGEPAELQFTMAPGPSLPQTRQRRIGIVSPDGNSPRNQPGGSGPRRRAGHLVAAPEPGPIEMPRPANAESPAQWRSAPLYGDDI